jgi:hypothetical protein
VNTALAAIGDRSIAYHANIQVMNEKKFLKHEKKALERALHI